MTWVLHSLQALGWLLPPDPPVKSTRFCLGRGALLPPGPPCTQGNACPKVGWLSSFTPLSSHVPSWQRPDCCHRSLLCLLLTS